MKIVVIYGQANVNICSGAGLSLDAVLRSIRASLLESSTCLLPASNKPTPHHTPNEKWHTHRDAAQVEHYKIDVKPMIIICVPNRGGGGGGGG